MYLKLNWFSLEQKIIKGDINHFKGTKFTKNNTYRYTTKENYCILNLSQRKLFILFNKKHIIN